HLRRVSRIRTVRHHAVEAGQAVRDDRPAVLLLSRFDERSGTVHKDRRRPKLLSVPDTFPFDLGIVSKGAARGRWEAEIDRVAEVVAGKSQAQAHRVLAPAALNRMVASKHAARKDFGSGPQRRLQSAFTSERWNHPALCC